MSGLLRELRFLAAEVLRALVLLTALACAVGGVAGLLGAFNHVLDLGSHLAPAWLAFGPAAALLGGLLDRRRVKWPVILGLTGAVAGAALMAGEFAYAARAQTGTGPERLKIVQLNLWAKNPDLPGTARWILREDPDVVVLEEAASNPVLRLLKARYPVQITCAHPHSCSPMILLKRQPLAYGGVSTSPEPSLNWVRIGGPNPFTLVAIHQVKPYDPVLPDSLERTRRRLGAFDRESLIVAGDFNATAWSHTLRREVKALGLTRRTRAMPTWPTWTAVPLLPIDHVLAGDAWRTVEVRRGPKVGSDHYPVVITLARGR